MHPYEKWSHLYSNLLSLNLNLKLFLSVLNLKEVSDNGLVNSNFQELYLFDLAKTQTLTNVFQLKRTLLKA